MTRPGKIISALILAAVIAPILLILSVYAGLFGHLQSREELLRYENAKASVVLSLEGSPI
ncbi:MAG: hypothetical protein IH593_05525, partial [Bacteroidales bacterium]|nr:hypothetical protein [Bacteroidales bacterium]